MMNSPTTDKKAEAAEGIRMMEEWLAAGNEITKCPSRLASGIRWLAPQRIRSSDGERLTDENQTQ